MGAASGISSLRPGLSLTRTLQFTSATHGNVLKVRMILAPCLFLWPQGLIGGNSEELLDYHSTSKNSIAEPCSSYCQSKRLRNLRTILVVGYVPPLVKLWI